MSTDVQSSEISQEVPMNQEEEMAKKKAAKRKPREIPVVSEPAEKIAEASEASEPEFKLAAAPAEPVKVRKSTAVRDYLAAHPDAKNADVVAALAAMGVAIAPAYVSILRSKAGKPKSPRGRRVKDEQSSIGAVGLKESLVRELRKERASLAKRIEAIDTLLN